MLSPLLFSAPIFPTPFPLANWVSDLSLTLHGDIWHLRLLRLARMLRGLTRIHRTLPSNWIGRAPEWLHALCLGHSTASTRCGSAGAGYPGHEATERDLSGSVLVSFPLLFAVPPEHVPKHHHTADQDDHQCCQGTCCDHVLVALRCRGRKIWEEKEILFSSIDK